MATGLLLGLAHVSAQQLIMQHSKATLLMKLPQQHVLATV
jgi:hypothetical protein